MKRAEYGLQMYSLRDITKDDLKGALKMVAEMGYKYVEFAKFFGNSAEDVKAWLDEYGLICPSSHTGMPMLADEAIDDTIAYHKVLGCNYFVIPGGMNWSTKENLEKNIEWINKIQKKLKTHGITLGYHNHTGEFLESDYGMFIGEELIRRTEIELEVDTFWAFNAGVDPVAYCERMKDRIRMIHLKDGIPCTFENRNFFHAHDGVQGMSVGAGKAPVKEVRDWAIANDVLIVIESEGLNPTGPEEVQRCIDYLRSLEK